MQCFKCKQGIGIIASRDGIAKLYCSDCFLSYSAGAVRESLFQHCLVPCDTPLAVAVSGGPNSMMLLRELGELRHATREALRRQQAVQEHRRRLAEAFQQQAQVHDAVAGHPCHTSPGEATTEVCSSSASARSTSASLSSLVLLPFHLCEDELIVPSVPPTTSTTPSNAATSAAAASPAAPIPYDRKCVIEAARTTMLEQFATLRKYVEQQPWRWSSALHHREKTTTQSQRGIAGPAAAAGGGDSGGGGGGTAHEGDGATATSLQAQLFDAGEMRVFLYSDFFSASYIEEVRHALHVSQLSLTDREALYDRVRQQTLCRAAQRLCGEYRASAAPTGDVAEVCSTPPAVPPAAGGEPWSHLLLGSNAVRCATAALEALVTGAGGEGVVHGAGFRGFVHQVVSLRPLRTMLPKETMQYTRLRGIACGYTPALCTGTSARSIRRTLEQFVLTMMASYRTMIFNVLNTVQRLEVHPAAVQAVVKGPGMTPTTAASLSKDEGRPQARGKAGKKALPGRTAPQNRDDLRRVVPPPVRYQASSSTDALRDGDGGGMSGACCVCGCPAPAPTRPPAAAAVNSSGNDNEVHPGVMPTNGHHLELFAVPMAPLQPAALVDEAVASWFVCYACRSLAEAWPASCFPQDDTPTLDTTALQHLCALLQ